MKPFSNTRTKRNTVLVVLLVWLFALASGVANACPPQVRESFSLGSPVAQASARVTVAGMSAGHGEAIASNDAGSGASEASCLEVLDTGAQALFKQRSGLDLSDPGLLPLVALVWTAAAVAVVAAPNRVGALQPPAPRQPIRVCFSRLAL